VTRHLGSCYNREFMVQFFLAVLSSVTSRTKESAERTLEILALRQQVAVLKRKRGRT
jgi:hypothetical protein